jgi:hypothetical protein
MRALRKPPLAGAVRARLDQLANWRACGLAPQASAALGNPHRDRRRLRQLADGS